MKKIKSISVVDDDPITIFGIKKILTSLNVCDTIETYSNGKEAIDAIKDTMAIGGELPDIIFLDINMPIMDGWQFLREFISLPLKKRIRVNIITSSIDPYDKQNWEKYKAATQHLIDFRNKPIKRTEIEEITKVA